MPPVSTKPKSRRGGRGYDDKHAQETEQKRNTGERSCAECSRLKIKCDKRIPCQSCQRRGCETLCPNGSLPTGEGTRSIVAATEHLHCQLADKNEQIRQLKDALSKCHARHSTEPHPLLRPGVLEASQGENHVGPPFAEDLATIEHTPELVGTPSISGSGASRFSGPMGGSHCLSMVDNVPSQDFADRPSDMTRDFESSGLPREISRFTPAFLSEPGHSTLNVETLINDRLPTWERARYLTKTYLDGEELGSRPLVQQSTFAASPALHPGTSSQSIAPLHTDTPHVLMQAPVEFAVQPSYYGEQLVFSCLQQPGSAAGPGQVWMPYSDVPSDSTLAQSLASSQAPPRLPSEASAQGELAAGSSTSTWLPEPSGPYPMADISAPSEQAHPQGFHTPHDRYDQHEHCSSTSPASLSYHDIRFDDTYESHRQSWPQRHPSAHLYPHSPSHPRYPTQSPPCQRQPTHSDPPQSQTVLLDPPELARLGLVGRESGLDQHGVSFIRESGFFDG